MIALENKNFDAAEYIATYKDPKDRIDFRLQDKNGRTAFMYAVISGDSAIVSKMAGIRKWAETINMQDTEKKTALMHAMLLESKKDGEVPRIVLHLLSIYVNNVVGLDNHGKTALMYAAGRNRQYEDETKDIVAQLVRTRLFFINAESNEGKTALAYAVEAGNCGVAQYLVDNGASVNKLTNEQKKQCTLFPRNKK